MKRLILLFFISLPFGKFCYSQQIQTSGKCHFIRPDVNLIDADKIPLSEARQGSIPKGEVLNVIGYDTVSYIWYKVKYKKKEGYIHRNVVVDRSFLIIKDPKIRNEYKECVIERAVAIGMTKYELTSSMGAPLEINRTVNASGVKEQHCYGTVNTRYYAVGFTLHSTSTTTNKKYIYLEDDIVTSYSD